MMSEAKNKAKSLLLQYGISKITLDNLLYIVEKQGFEVLEYSQLDCTDAVWKIIGSLKLTSYAQSGKAFAYQNGRTKLIFLCDELSADEKLYALAHEEAHILCGHLSSGAYDSGYVEQEYLANEVAHYLLKPPIHIKLCVKLLERKKLVAVVISAIGILAVVLMITITVYKNNSYHDDFFITETGTKYHEKDCMIIKDKMNLRRLTEEDYASGDYKPCQVCLPD